MNSPVIEAAPGVTTLSIPEITPDMDILSAAFAYANSGFYIAPVLHETKNPGRLLGKGWQHKTSRDPEQIVDWFAGTNYALALHMGRSGAVAFDVDRPDLLPEPLVELFDTAPAPHQSTRSGTPGRGHYVYAMPANRTLGNGTGKLGGGFGEVRGANGVIVVAPTIHEKADVGGRYLWLRTGPVPVLTPGVAALLPDALAADEAATDAQVQAFLDANGGNARPNALGPILRKFSAEVEGGASRHATAVTCAVWALKEARAGYFSARDAVSQLGALFFESLKGERSGVTEFDGIVAWAVAQAGVADIAEVRKISDRNTKPTRPAPAVLATDGTAALDERPKFDLIEGGAVEFPAVDVGSDPKAIIELSKVINGGAIPDLYVRNGELIRVGRVSGGINPGEIGPQVDTEVIGADAMRRLLAYHVDTFRWKITKDETTRVQTSPSVTAIKSVLTTTYWPSVPVLSGVAVSPVLRPDGTLLQEPGYDKATGLYYAPALEMPAVPETPSAEDVAEAKTLLFEHVLGDFPWASDADRANYLALLMTPILRPYVGGLVPLGAISATERGSGKTLLSNIIGHLFGMTSRAWVSSDEEIRKAVTGILSGSTPVVLFDNVGEHDQVSAPSLAKLLTSTLWDDRTLGVNKNFRGVNDRLWLVTGNSLEFGGDIAQRTVLVRIDPKCPRPDLRTGFHIENLDAWLEEEGNQVRLLRALLILARDWIASGGKREEFVMRGFGRWVCGMGGFLAHHGVVGFLGNVKELEEHDEEASTWAGFLHTWYQNHGSAPKTATQIRASAESMGFGPDPWSGTFVTRGDTTTLPTARGLGMMLARRRGRFYGGYSLDGAYDTHEKTWRWTVRPYEPS